MKLIISTTWKAFRWTGGGSFAGTGAGGIYCAKQSLPNIAFRCLSSSSGPEHTAPSAAQKTLALQSQVDRMPLPNLEETGTKFLRSARPFLDEMEYETTVQEMKELCKPGGLGQKLQGLLKQRAVQKENWFSDWWLDMAYMGYRDPLVVWSSPGLAWPSQNFPAGQDDQIRFAAKVIAGALSFKIAIDTESIPIEMVSGKPVDMNNYFLLYGTTRLPGIEKDRLSLNPGSKHIVVIHKNNFFRLEAYGLYGEWLNVEQFYACLKEIVHESDALGYGPAVGILTTDNRDQWGKNFQILAQNKVNADTLTEIERSLFTISLDPPTTDVSAPNDMTRSALQSLHGMGSGQCSANRWYDKCIQFYVGESGQCGMTCEHGPAEGPPFMNITDHCLDFAAGKGVGGTTTTLPGADFKPPRHLPFTVDSEAEELIAAASQSIDSLVEDVELFVLNLTDFGKNFIKSQRLSPDSFIQMGIQLAFYRLHGSAGAHYESGGIRRFLHGRTEVIRSCSVESVHFARTMLDVGATNDDKRRALTAAIHEHQRYARMATSELGVDRHLQGLKRAAQEYDLQVPSLFNDPGYTRSCRMRISSSQVAGKSSSIMNYGVLQMDGYGCCYNPRKDNMLFAVSAMRSCPETSAFNFQAALAQSFRDMRDVCSANNKPLKAKL